MQDGDDADKDERHVKASFLVTETPIHADGQARHALMRRLHDLELEPEVRDWLDSLSDSDYKRVNELSGMLAEKVTQLGGPWSDHLECEVWELLIRLRDVAARVTYWCTADGRIVLLTAFRKTKQHDQRQIDRAVRAQKICVCPGHLVARWTRGGVIRSSDRAGNDPSDLGWVECILIFRRGPGAAAP